MADRFEIVADYGWGGFLVFLIPFIKQSYVGKLTESHVETRSGKRYQWKDLVRVYSNVTPHGATVATGLDFGSGRVQINYGALRNGAQIFAAIESIRPKN